MLRCALGLGRQLSGGLGRYFGLERELGLGGIGRRAVGLRAGRRWRRDLDGTAGRGLVLLGHQLGEGLRLLGLGRARLGLGLRLVPGAGAWSSALKRSSSASAGGSSSAGGSAGGAGWLASAVTSSVDESAGRCSASPNGGAAGSGGAAGPAARLDQAGGLLAADLAGGGHLEGWGGGGAGGLPGAALGLRRGRRTAEELTGSEGVGPLARAERVLLDLAQLGVAGAVPALQVEVFADGVVEDAHGCSPRRLDRTD